MLLPFQDNFLAFHKKINYIQCNYIQNLQFQNYFNIYNSMLNNILFSKKLHFKENFMYFFMLKNVLPIRTKRNKWKNYLVFHCCELSTFFEKNGNGWTWPLYIYTCKLTHCVTDVFFYVIIQDKINEVIRNKINGVFVKFLFCWFIVYYRGSEYFIWLEWCSDEATSTSALSPLGRRCQNAKKRG